MTCITARPAECPADSFPSLQGSRIGIPLVARLVAELRLRRTIAVLKTLDDHQLRDIGAEEIIGLKAGRLNMAAARKAIRLLSKR